MFHGDSTLPPRIEIPQWPVWVGDVPDFVIEHSTVIVLGQVKSTSRSWFGEWVGAPWSNTRLLRETVELDVLQTLKGQVDTTSIDFDHWVWDESSPDAGRSGRMRLYPGQTAVFLLDFDHREEVLRATVDMNEVSVFPVCSGQTGNERIPAEMDTIQERISWLLLTPGASVDPEGFASCLKLTSRRSAINGALWLLGRVGTIRHLRELVSNESTQISTEACLALADELFLGQYECIQEFLDEGKFDQEQKQRATRLLSQGQAMDGRMKVEMGRRMTEFLVYSAAINPHEELCEALAQLGLHRDPEIRRLACEYQASQLRCPANTGCESVR